MEKRAIMQPANALLPNGGFAPERLLAPGQAMVAYFSRVAIAKPAAERVPLEAAFARILAEPIAAGDDYPAAARSAMDGFAIRAQDSPGPLRIAGDVRMGGVPQAPVSHGIAARIPTGGMLPEGADAVVPIEDTTAAGDESVIVNERLREGENVVPRGADMRRGEIVLHAGRRIAARDIGVLATLGIVDVPVYRRPVVGVLSSGDELVDPSQSPRPGEIRDSNRYAIAASLRAMGADARQFPTLRDEEDAFAAGLSAALAQCDAIVVSGGSSVGERDRLPGAVAALGEPGVVVHGLRVKPGKPLLLGALAQKPVIGLPGNPASALMMLEAVAAPIVGALAGWDPRPDAVSARLAEPLRGRPGWTWFVPVALRDDGGTLVAHPLALRSFSVSLAARADGYAVVGERDEEFAAGATVSVRRFFGG